MNALVVSGMYRRPSALSAGAGFVHRQVLELRNHGVDVRVVCPIARIGPRRSPGGFMGSLLQRESTVLIDGVPVVYLPYWNVPHRVSASLAADALKWALESCLRRIRIGFDFEILHANHLFPIGYTVQRIARELDKPVVIGARGSDVHTNPGRNSGVARLTRETIRRGGVYAVSEGLANLVRLLGPPPAAVPVVRNGVDASRFQPLNDKARLRVKLGLPEEGAGIATVGRLVPDKGVLELVQALSTVRVQRPDVWLVIIGDGRGERMIRAAIKRHGLVGNVFLPGRRPHAELPHWLNAADVFALPSYNEGLPNVLLEAMACGLPVVATDVGGVGEVVLDGVTGLLVPPRQTMPLGIALERLLDDANLRESMAFASLERVRREFSWTHSAVALLTLYNNAVRSHVGTRSRDDRAMIGV